MSGRTRIDELAKIEFDGAKAVTLYAKTLRDLLRDLDREADFAAEDFEAVITSAARSGHPLLMGVDVKWRARRCANRLRRASDALRGAAAEVTRFHAAFRREFAGQLQPPAKQRKFDFEDE